jgi:Transposase DDE domain
MLCEDKVISIFCIVDDVLKAMGHREDNRIKVSDAEVITTSFVATLYFGGHMDNARMFMKRHVPEMLSKSRFCRRLHRLSELLLLMFSRIGYCLKDIAGANDYVIDSFPVAACDNIRINRNKLLNGEEKWRGKHASMRRYFFGVRVQVLTFQGTPVEFCITPGRENDNNALNRLPLDVASGSCIYADSAYLNYEVEDMLAEDGIQLRAQRKSNSVRKDEPWMIYLKEQMRKGIETTFSQIKSRMLRHIHAVTQQGFMIKVSLFVIAYTFENIVP